ncbi:hypothetical protein [Streptantibioticus ferralitis]|uniref:Uncharacterized protein n=1 Tax=Streptantibioticus ferralitis TaxID=236510 RepID=A0ABT5YYQ6_9ACTN|nr:hypothetical protein [Streptantibioticus ferralitis]MDF2256731.1 hypothetical protein [Streptantibioticus ferralitis]
MADDLCENTFLPPDQCDHCRMAASGLSAQVHTTKGGSVYHRTPNCAGLKDGQAYARRMRQEIHDVNAVPRSDARARLGPCEVCRPDLPPTTS